MEHIECNTYVRPTLSSRDRERLLALHNENFPDSRWSEAYPDTFFSDRNRFPMLVAVRCDGELAGFAVGRLEKNNPREFMLSSIAVAKQYRGKSYAQEIMRKLFHAVVSNTQAEKIVLHFRESKKLHGFYSKLGFGNHRGRGTYENGDAKQYMDISRSDIMKHIR
jgi:ribosomal protein S18 acetylase RimI-like enzyme